MEINMDMSLFDISFPSTVCHLENKAIKVKKDDNICSYFNEVFKGYVLFEVNKIFVGRIATGKTLTFAFAPRKPEVLEFTRVDKQLVYVDKRFLKDCGDGVWFISDKSYKYIFNNLCNANPNQIRGIID